MPVYQLPNVYQRSVYIQEIVANEKYGGDMLILNQIPNTKKIVNNNLNKIKQLLNLAVAKYRDLSVARYLPLPS